MAEIDVPKQIEGEKALGPAPVPVVAPLTASQFSKEFEDLFARAKAAGLNPRKLVLATFARQGLSVFEQLLTAIDEKS